MAIGRQRPQAAKDMDVVAGQADDGEPVDGMTATLVPSQIGQARGDGGVGIVGAAAGHRPEQQDPGLPLGIGLATSTDGSRVTTWCQSPTGSSTSVRPRRVGSS